MNLLIVKQKKKHEVSEIWKIPERLKFIKQRLLDSGIDLLFEKE